MASRYWRVLDVRKLTASLEQPRDQYIDAGAFAHLEVDVRVVVAGTAGNIKLQHAAVNEPDAFRDLATMSWPLTGAGSFLFTDHFLRYIRWVTDAGLTGSPQVIIDIVGKE